MKLLPKTIQALTLGSLAVLTAAVACGQKDQHAPAVAKLGETYSQVRLSLVDGSSIAAAEAWESEQGIWYRQGGLSYLLARQRVKAIERKLPPSTDTDDQAINLASSSLSGNRSDTATGVPAQPVWIHLVGGPRVEADTAIESVEGVWYTRDKLSIFVERGRIDHIERQAVETAPASDSNSRKERGWTTGNPRLDSLIKHNGGKYGVDPYLIFCVMEQESRFNTRALSPKGAQGLMQLMPGTAARFGVKRSSDPAQNIAGGTRYLKQLIAQFDGRIDLVLASYNAGEGAVLKYGRRVPPYRETRDYVKRISYRYGRSQPSATAKKTSGAVTKAAQIIRPLPAAKKRELNNE